MVGKYLSKRVLGNVPLPRVVLVHSGQKKPDYFLASPILAGPTNIPTRLQRIKTTHTVIASVIFSPKKIIEENSPITGTPKVATDIETELMRLPTAKEITKQKQVASGPINTNRLTNSVF